MVNHDEFKASAQISVTNATTTGMEMTASAEPLPIGLTAQLRAFANLSDGTTVDVTEHPSLLWSSNAPEVASVSNTGLATGLTPGSVVITASGTLNGVNVTASKQITVSQAAVTRLEIRPEEEIIPVGLQTQLTAIAHLSDGTSLDVTQSNDINWHSDHAEIAALSPLGSQGLVTGQAVGTALITANGILKGALFTASARLDVSPAVVTELVLAPLSASVSVGDKIKFQLKATFSNGSTQDVTEDASVRWHSDTPSVADISDVAGNRGEVSGLAEGATFITASVAGVPTVTASLAVTPLNDFCSDESQSKVKDLPYIITQTLLASDQCSVLGVASCNQSPYYGIDRKLWATASTYDELKHLIAQGQKYIHIPNDVIIRVPNIHGAITLGDNQIISSTRSETSEGGLLLVEKNQNNSADKYPVIYMKSNSRISGLRIEGPDSSSNTVKATIGIQTYPGSINPIVDNNEIYNWPWAGVSVKGTKDAEIKRNYIHDNIRSQLGYGVVVQNGHAVAHIECNIFNRNRHAIAGSGRSGEGYYATNNLVMQGGGRGAYHQFDMHADSSEPKYGGDFLVLKNNWFDFGAYGTSNRSSIVLRGIPRQGVAVITGNKFKSNVQVTSTTDTVSGVQGSIPTRDELREKNTFSTRYSYYQNDEKECIMQANNEIRQIHCKALSH